MRRRATTRSRRSHARHCDDRRRRSRAPRRARARTTHEGGERRRPAMVVGPENIAVVKARADSIRSGDLGQPRAGGAGERCARKSAARYCRRIAEAGRSRVARAGAGAHRRRDACAKRSSRRSPRSTNGAERGRHRTSGRSIATKRCSRRARSPSAISSWRATSCTAAQAQLANAQGELANAQKQLEQGDGRRAVRRRRERASGERGRRRAAGRRAVHDRESGDDASRGVGAGRPVVGGAHRRAGGLHGQRLSESPVHGPRHAHQSGGRSDDAPGADHRVAAERERRARRRSVRRRPRRERSAHGAGRSDRRRSTSAASSRS